jgi:hypothetical protein
MDAVSSIVQTDEADTDDNFVIETCTEAIPVTRVEDNEQPGSDTSGGYSSFSQGGNITYNKSLDLAKRNVCSCD